MNYMVYTIINGEEKYYFFSSLEDAREWCELNPNIDNLIYKLNKVD